MASPVLLRKEVGAPPSDREIEAPIGAHLAELRRRLLVSLSAFVVAGVGCYLAYRPILEVLLTPFAALRDPAGLTPLLYANGIAEGFLVRLRVAVNGGLVFSLPVHLYGLVRFVFPALARRARRAVGIGLGVSFVLACFSAWYAFTLVLPASVRLMTAPVFIPEGVGVLLGFSRNVSFLFWVVAAAVLLFQAPVVLSLLLALGVVRRKGLLRASRYVVVVIFAASAVLTPPDVVSQLALAVPLVALYFLTLLVARLFRFGEG